MRRGRKAEKIEISRDLFLVPEAARIRPRGAKQEQL